MLVILFLDSQPVQTTTTRVRNPTAMTGRRMDNVTRIHSSWWQSVARLAGSARAQVRNRTQNSHHQFLAQLKEVLNPAISHFQIHVKTSMDTGTVSSGQPGESASRTRNGWGTIASTRATSATRRLSHQKRKPLTGGSIRTRISLQVRTDLFWFPQKSCAWPTLKKMQFANTESMTVWSCKLFSWIRSDACLGCTWHFQCFECAFQMSVPRAADRDRTRQSNWSLFWNFAQQLGTPWLSNRTKFSHLIVRPWFQRTRGGRWRATITSCWWTVHSTRTSRCTTRSTDASARTSVPPRIRIRSQATTSTAPLPVSRSAMAICGKEQPA